MIIQNSQDKRTQDQAILNNLARIHENTNQLNQFFSLQQDRDIHRPYFDTEPPASNLKLAHQYYVKEQTPSSFYEMLQLNDTQQAIVFCNINDHSEQAKNLITGYLKGILNTLAQYSTPKLFSPEITLAYLFEQLAELEAFNEIKVQLWYGVFNLAKNELHYAGSDKVQPLQLNTSTGETTTIQGSNYHSFGESDTFLFMTGLGADSASQHASIGTIFRNALQKAENIHQAPDLIMTGIRQENLEFLRQTGLSQEGLITIAQTPQSKTLSIELAEHEELNYEKLEQVSKQVRAELFNTSQLHSDLFEAGVETLLGLALDQVQRGRIILDELTDGHELGNDGDENSTLQIKTWQHERHTEISILLSGIYAPWIYLNPENNFAEDLGIEEQLGIYFDSLGYSSDGSEISVSLRY